LIQSAHNSPILQHDQLNYLFTSWLSKEIVYESVSNVISYLCYDISLSVFDSLNSESFIVLCYELYDLYSALRGQVDFVNQSAKLSNTEREKGLQIMQQRLHRAIKSDERLVKVTIEGIHIPSVCDFMESFRSQLHPSRWKRTSLCLTNENLGLTWRESDSCIASPCLTSVSRQNEGENDNNGQIRPSPPINVSSNRYKLSDAF